MLPAGAFDVFLSFSQQDRATAEAACALLEANGVKCWIAPRNIPPGQPYAEGIMSGLNSARVMVLIFSSHANNSAHVQREVERAINRSMPVLPFRIENVPPSRGLEYFLSLPNWLDAFTPPLEPHLAVLVKSAKDLLGQAQAASPKPLPPVDPPTVPGPLRDWRVFAGAFGLLGAGALAWSLWPSPPASAPVMPAPAPVEAQTGRELAVDFASAKTSTAPSYMVAAAPYLHAAKAKISVADIVPATSRLVLINNLGLYEGKAVKPTVSENMLTQTDTGNVPASFTLKFSEPQAAVSFLVPAVWPATESGITFPAWRAVALSASGAELSSASLGLLRRFADEPARSFTLSAPGFEGIAAVRFASDPNLDGRPFAAFSAILIEELKLTPQ